MVLVGLYPSTRVSARGIRVGIESHEEDNKRTSGSERSFKG